MKNKMPNRRWKYELLQSQINPHFLYNTLNTIKSLIELDMKETAVKAVSAMSTFTEILFQRDSLLFLSDKS
ncbi:MAG: histidine kinase [Blautia wexlerae]